jgi:hypothetical protein
VSNPSLLPELEVVLLGGVEFTSASSHDVTVARDSVSHVEVRDSVGEEGRAEFSLTRRLVSELVNAGRLNDIITYEMRSELSQTGADFIKRVVGKGGSHLFREST